jgi:hypothetical protein
VAGEAGKGGKLTRGESIAIAVVASVVVAVLVYVVVFLGSASDDLDGVMTAHVEALRNGAAPAAGDPGAIAISRRLAASSGPVHTRDMVVDGETACMGGSTVDAAGAVRFDALFRKTGDRWELVAIGGEGACRCTRETGDCRMP